MSSAPPPAPPPLPAGCASPLTGGQPLPPATPLHLSVLRPLSFHSPQPTPLSARRPSVLTYTPPPSKDAMPSQLVQRPSRSTSVSSGAEPYYRGSPHHVHHQQQQHGMPPPHSLLMSPHTPDQRYNDRMMQDSPMDGGPTYIVRTRDVEQTPPSVGGTPRARRNSTPKAVKVFQCSGYGHCTMTFTRSEHLARHVRKHTGEKPFVCHCSKQFSRIDNLRQHCATVHSELADQNEATIKSLLPVHSALSQQAGRKHNPNARARQQPAHPPSPPRRQPNKLAPIGEHEMSPYHHASSSDAGHDSGHDVGHARPGASPHEHVRQPSAGRRFQSSQPEPMVSNDGRPAGWNTGLRLSWNGEGDPPEGLGLIKRDSSSIIGSSMWPDDGGRASRPVRHEPANYDEGESEIGSGSEEDEVAYHRRGSDSNVQFGHAWAPTQVQPIPPPLHFHPTHSNFSAPPHHLQPPSEANTPSTSSLLTFPSSAQSTQMPTSATGTSFGLSPLLDVGGSDSRPGSRPTSRGASLDLSYPLPWGASSATTTSYQLHQHPAFGSALLAPNLSSGGEKINEHQSTFRPDSYHGEQNTRQIFLSPAPIGGRTIYDDRQHPETLASHRQDTRAPSPPPQSMLWGLPQLTSRKHRLASISQQGNQGGLPSPESSRSSVQWGADGAAMTYSGGRQEAPKVQRRMSLPYAHHDHHPSYAFGNQRPHPQQQYHHHPQHPGMTSYHSDTFVPQVNHEGHHIDSPHHMHQSSPHHHQNPHPHPPVHLRGFSSTPVHCVSLPTQHHAISDHSPFSYHAPSSSRAFGSAHEMHHHHDGSGSSLLGTDMFARPLAISPALPVEDLSPLTIAPDLPRLGDRHDDLPPHSHSESASGSSSLGTTNNTPVVGNSPETSTHHLGVLRGAAVHISSSGHSSSSNGGTSSDRSPSPANLEVHLSLDPHSLHHKHSRIFSGPMVTSALLPLPSLSSYAMQKDTSNTSTTSSLDSATGFPREKRRTSLALSVSDLMGPSVECASLSRPQTSAGVMEVLGERDAEGEEEIERPRTAGGSL